jgi:hypothetical protein
MHLHVLLPLTNITRIAGADPDAGSNRKKAPSDTPAIKVAPVKPVAVAPVAAPTTPAAPHKFTEAQQLPFVERAQAAEARLGELSTVFEKYILKGGHDAAELQRLKIENVIPY